MDLLEQMQLAHRGRLDRKVLLGLVARLVQQVGLDRVVPLGLLVVRVRQDLLGQQGERDHRGLVALRGLVPLGRQALVDLREQGLLGLLALQGRQDPLVQAEQGLRVQVDPVGHQDPLDLQVRFIRGKVHGLLL